MWLPSAVWSRPSSHSPQSRFEPSDWPALPCAPKTTVCTGWPCDKPLDDLRTAWLKETDPARRKQLLDQFHARAFEALPYISAGQYSPAMAVRKEIKGVEKLWGGLPLVWNLDK